ncbi:hypothetical protein Tco_0909170 [Tanacetum coccineum]|uniref:Uncharacterized protein n=1 Tax=Tanacetum coccineum TaxID=301880 RepID=A0ABQ5CPD3_9ASTR
MVAENTKKTPQGSASVQPATQRATPKKQTTTTPVKQTKPAPPPSKKPSKRKLPQKVRKGKPAFQLLSLDPALSSTKVRALLEEFMISVIQYPKATPKLHEDKHRSTVTSGVSIPVSDPEKAHEAQAGPDPEPMQEDQTGSDSGKLHVSLAGPNPEHMMNESLQQPPKDVTSSITIITGHAPPINTEATTITTSLLKSLHCIALQLRIPTAVDNYLGTKLDDALIKVLERHTADLIEKYSVLPGPESVKNQESEKSPKEIIKAKKEQAEEKQDSTYSIRSTDEVDIEEFDLKSALFSHMNKKKQVKVHKRKHDSDDDDEDDDDDEGPSAGSNQGTKRRRSESAASGSSAKPPPKADDQSSKKTRESEASASKKHPSLSSTGWQITDTREAGVDSSSTRF